MSDVLKTLLMFPLVWTITTFAVATIVAPWILKMVGGEDSDAKPGPGHFVLGMVVSVVFTSMVFGAPGQEGFLTAVLLWPMLGAFVALFMPRQWSDGIRRFASIWAWAGFVLSLYLVGPVVRDALAPTPEAIAQSGALSRLFWGHFALPFFGSFATDASLTFSTAGFRLVEDVAWIETFGIHYKLGIDGISLWLVMLTTLLTPLALDVSWNSVNMKVKEFAFSFLMLEVGMLGAFVALDLFLFYVFWELMLVPMYLIIGIWGGKERVYAAVKFFIFTMVGSLLMLVAILYVVTAFQNAPENTAHVMTFDLQQIGFLSLPKGQQLVLFFAFALAFAIKVPMFPFHTWLPDAHVQAPTGGSVILAAVLLKLGGYGFIRFAMPLFPWASRYVAPTLAVFAVIGIIYGAYCAWVQRDVKKLVAYSSVSHLGFVMLGLFASTQSSVSGAILQMVAHGVSTGALFILVGVVYDRRHTRDLADFGGLAKVMPMYATLFVIVAMSSVGLPGTNGFVGEFMILSGTFTSMHLGVWQKTYTILAATGVILAAIYMLHAVLKMLWGPVNNEKNKDLPDLSIRERWVLAPLIVLIFWIGIVPGFFLHPMQASVQGFLSQWSDRAGGIQTEEARILEGGLPAPEVEVEVEAEAAADEDDGETAARWVPDEQVPDEQAVIAALAPGETR